MLLIPATAEDVVNALEYSRREDIPWRVIGSGSNLLVPDTGLPGLTIKFWQNFNDISIEGSFLKAQSGADMLAVAMRAGENDLSGLEWACGIPGTIGGAIHMNAGIRGEEIKDTLVSATVIRRNGLIDTMTNEDLRFSYRYSILQETGDIVVEALFALEKDKKESIFERMNRHLDKRKGSQPIDLPNCGSVFRNPPGDYAGRLIEEAGLKGKQVGSVMISEQHANFIVNLGDGRAEDVLKLIELVKRSVYDTTGVELQLEVQIIS
jgi:UDP-N-acetylmuramate dehydrogenase